MSIPTIRIANLPSASAPAAADLLVGTVAATGAAANFRVDSLVGVTGPQAFIPTAASGTDIADGASHPLSDFYTTLGAAQVDFAHAIALTDELAWACIQAAVSAAAVQTTYSYALSSAVLLPAGDYRINRTVTLSGVRGMRFTGVSRATRLLWYGPTTVPIIDLPDSRECSLADFQLRPAVVASAGIRIWNTSAATTIPTSNVIERVLFDYVGAAVVDCVRIGDFAEGTNVDANNEYHAIRDCTLVGYSRSAVNIAASQAYNILLDNCQLSGNGPGGQYGVYCEYGSFMVRGGGGGYNTAADFYLGNQNSQPIAIDGFCSEMSARLLYAPNFSTALKAVDIAHVRWSSTQETGTGRVIEINCQMALTIRNTRLNDLNHAGRSGGQVANYIYCAGGFGADTSKLILDDVNIGTSAATAAGPFVGVTGPTSYRGLRRYTTDAATVVPLALYPDQLAGATPNLRRLQRGGDTFARFANGGATTVTNLLNGEPGTTFTLMGDGNTTINSANFVLTRGAMPYLLAAGEMLSLVYDAISTKFREVR